MCEKTKDPSQGGGNDTNPQMEVSEINTEDDQDMSPEEFEVLDKQLDALNSALDNIEQKNDDIRAQLAVLLESNREIRKEIQTSH